MRRLSRLPAALLAVAVVAAGCGGGHVAAALPSLPTGSAVTALVEPDDGYDTLYGWLGAARSTLDLTMYELVDDHAVAVLEADAARGVRVRVLLDAQRERRANLPAYLALRDHGVEVRWASNRYAATHEKSFVVDGRALVVMSLNLTSRYYPTSRDVAVLTQSAADVAAAEQVFAADWAGRSVGTPPGADLVWSPRQSQADLVALVDSAQSSVWLESEEYAERDVLAAMIRAARRGVDVRVAMTYQKDWAKNWDALVDAGGHVSYFQGEHPLYIHAKIVVVDAGTPRLRVFAGSENLTNSSLNLNRELGIVLVGGPAAGRLSSTVASDLAAGRTWHP
ncbi:MAG TPA: phospholipase D-like domain-containing protein [Mycobacteriales bacterium]